MIRHKDCLDAQRRAIKDILIAIEDVAEKYNVNPVDYNIVRSIVKSRIIGLSNIWHRFLGTLVDAKFLKKINGNGEKEETHLGVKNGEHSG